MNKYAELNYIRQQLMLAATKKRKKELSKRYREIKKQSGIQDIVIEKMLFTKGIL